MNSVLVPSFLRTTALKTVPLGFFIPVPSKYAKHLYFPAENSFTVWETVNSKSSFSHAVK